MSASAWMDRKVVMVMSTNCQPSDSSTVQRKQKDGSSVEVPCPASIISYNKFMGGVDRETRYADTIAADQEVQSISGWLSQASGCSALWFVYLWPGCLNI